MRLYIDGRKQGPRTRHKKEPALLTGLLYAPDGQRMLPTYTVKKNGKRYRYYVPYLEKRQSAGATYDPTIRNIGPLPAGEIEAAVLAQVHKALQKPEMIVGVWRAGMALREQQDIDEPTVLVAMRQMSAVWDNLFPIEQNRIVRLLIERVQLHEDGLDIIWRDDSWQRFCRELERHEFVQFGGVRRWVHQFHPAQHGHERGEGTSLDEFAPVEIRAVGFVRMHAGIVACGGRIWPQNFCGTAPNRRIRTLRPISPSPLEARVGRGPGREFAEGKLRALNR